MRLWILRHAHASPASGAMGDHERPLSDRGAREAESVGAYLRSAARLQIILHSPYLRARQTAEAIGRHLPEVRCEADDRLTSDRHPRAIIDHLAKSGLSEVILVSHEPLTGDLAGWLIAGDLHGRISFSPATLALIDTGDRLGLAEGVLRQLCPPDLFLS